MVEDFVPEGMAFEDFRIGMEFLSGSGRWRVTDVGTRTVIAIRIDPVEIEEIFEGTARPMAPISQAEAEAQGWLNGPPYAVAEHVFDEDDFEGLSPAPVKRG